MEKKSLLIFSIFLGLIMTAQCQVQTWQWMKKGGCTVDNPNGGTGIPTPGITTVGGCDAKGNIYAAATVTGQNLTFDTFSSPGTYSANNVYYSYLLFSYDCAGNMRWAKEIGDEEGDLDIYGVVTDPQGNTYLAAQFFYGAAGGLVRLYLGDTLITPSLPMYTQNYLCLIKYDSLGRLVWLRNYESDTTYHSQYDYPYGLRIGSSGNIWMACILDSNYSFSNFQTSKKGKYNLEIDPSSGNILGGYYINNKIYGDDYLYSASYDLDENENYYECGTLDKQGNNGGIDTMILSNQIVTVDPSQTFTKPFIFSLDKAGNLRFLIESTVYSEETFSTCKYDPKTKKMLTSWILDSLSVFNTDTFRLDISKMETYYSVGLLATDTGGNILWGKYITSESYWNGIYFRQIPLPNIVDQISDVGTSIYAYRDTLTNRDTTGMGLNPDNYQKILTELDDSGYIKKQFVANMGALGNLRGYDRFPTGAIDWQGNIYVGGTITNYLATPADSVVNTDPNSGDFFIAKIGTSDCSCTSPGAQFSETSSGDTVRFMGSTIHYHDSIVWRLGDGTSYTGDTFTHIYTPDSSYIVTEIAYSQCGIDSVTRQITIAGGCTMPVAQFTQSSHGDTVSFSGTSMYADSVHWSFGDGSTSNLDTVTHIYTHDSTYTVVMIAYNGCGADTFTMQVTVHITGISVIGTDHTQLYPNPANDVLYLEVSGAAKIGFISANGTMLWDGPRQLSQAGTYIFDISGYSAGVYYMVIQYPDGQTETLPVTKK